MKKTFSAIVPLFSVTLLACGAQAQQASAGQAGSDQLAAHNKAAAPRDPTAVDQDANGLSAQDAAGVYADFSLTQLLDPAHWRLQPAACSQVRNACTDPNAERAVLDGSGKLTLSATAAQAAQGSTPRQPARYPSLDWIDPEAAMVAGRCLEVTVTFPQNAASYGGVVLAPDADAGFAGQLYMASSSAGVLRLGLACSGGHGSISFARPTDAAFLAAPHTLRLCADAEAASFEVDGELWAEVVEEELAEACGHWPFGKVASPLHAHFVVAPSSAPDAASDAAEMVVEKLSVRSAN